MRTVLYADVFNFPLTVDEIHHYLIHSHAVTKGQIEKTLETSKVLAEWLRVENGLIVRSDRADLITRRRMRDDVSSALWPAAVTYGTWLSRLPYVRMVAVTGALAVRNASSQTDDLDYLIVTTPGRVWIARAFAVLLVRLARLFNTQICPNYVLSQTALVQERQDLFIAHEVAQMVPLYGFELYCQFREQNHWVMEHLPNAEGAYRTETEITPGRSWKAAKTVLEQLLQGKVGDYLEAWEQKRKIKRFKPSFDLPKHNALLDEQHVKGHFQDYGYPALQQYLERLIQYNLIEPVENLRAAGD